LHCFVYRTKIRKFFENNKKKSIEILKKHGYEFLAESEAESLLKNNGFTDNGFILKFPFLENSKILSNEESNLIISEKIKNFKNQLANFYTKINNKSFANIERLPAHKDIVTENVHYSFFNLLNMKSIGHYVIIKKNGVKIEINIQDYDSKIHEGIIIYPNGNIYIGTVLIESVNFNNLKDSQTLNKSENKENSKQSRVSNAMGKIIKKNIFFENGIDIPENNDSKTNIPDKDFMNGDSNKQINLIKSKIMKKILLLILTIMKIFKIYCCLIIQALPEIRLPLILYFYIILKICIFLKKL